MGKIIDGKALSVTVKDEVRAQVAELEAKYGRKPCLCVIIVGETPASQVYVRNKVKAAAYTGMDSRLIELPADTSEADLLAQIVALNGDPAVDGILVQLPLPKHIDEEKVIDTIAREKDVDGFHPGNVSGLWLGKDCIVPCTPAGVIRLIDSTGESISGKTAHSRTADLGAVTRLADILVVAVGRAGLVTGDMVKPGAVVIDVGMNRNSEGKLCGDVDFASCEPVASWITPVPGGVGPMTIAMLMKNTIACYLSRLQA